jgi:hypothetical protein
VLVARQSGLDNFKFLQLTLKAEQVFPNPFHFIKQLPDRFGRFLSMSHGKTGDSFERLDS